MIKIISKYIATAIAMFAVAATANATFTNPAPLAYSIPGVLPVGSPNITSTGGKFKFKVKKNGSVDMSYKAKAGSKGSKGTSVLYGAPGVATGSLLIGADVKIKKGVLTIKGWDPISGEKGILVSANYDESSLGTGNIALNVFGTDDVFGFNITGIICPFWTFCTSNESVYITGEFGTNVNNIKIKGSKIGGATAVTSIPIPAALWLFGTGLIGLLCVARRRNVS